MMKHEDFWFWVARHLVPRKLRYFCLVVTIVDASVDDYPTEALPDLSVDQLINSAGKGVT